MAMFERFLAGYSENFMLALGLWPVFSALLTLPILAWLYHRDGRLRFGSAVSTYLTVLYALGIVCFTLWPLPSGDRGLGITYGVPWQLDPLAFVDDFRREGISVLPQIAFNVVLFVPLGFVCGRLFRWGLVPSVLAGLAVSFAVEAAQGTGLFGLYPYAFRTADVDDLVYNTLGALAGWGCSWALGRVLPPGALADEDDVTREPGFVRRCVALWLDLLLMGLAFLVVAVAVSLAIWNVPGLEALRDVPWAEAVLLAVFVLVEGVLPWRHDGSTPGGAFVRMSCETREREGWRRAAFYLVRLVVLGAVLLWFPVAWLPTLVFWLVARRMPYDLV